MKKLLSLLLALLILGSLAIPALAVESRVIYQGHNLFGFGPGSVYTDTDLFDNFKGVMPGDTLTETVTVRNEAGCCYSVKIYMQAVVHHDTENPLSPNVAREENLVSMEDFLSQLHMTVWNGDQKIFEGTPHEPDGLRNKILLGEFRRWQGTALTVELKVPAELGNEYANRVGEVDWVFLVEEYSKGGPQTGDHSHLLLYVLLMFLFLMAAALVLFGFKKRKRG